MPNEIIHDLGAKLVALAEALAEVGNDAGGSLRGLERRLGLPQDRLKSAARRERWSLHPDIIAVLAKAGSFKPDDYWWVDRRMKPGHRLMTIPEGYKGRDRADLFKRKVRVALGLDASVKLKLEPEKPQTLEGNLLTFELFASGQGR